MGTVGEHMLDGRMVISIDIGETHRSPSLCPTPIPTPAVDAQVTLTLTPTQTQTAALDSWSVSP